MSGELDENDPLWAIAEALPMVARLNGRLEGLWKAIEAPEFFDRSEDEWRTDMDTFLALLDSVWLRARHLIDFLLNWGRSDVVKASDYLPGWVLPDGLIRDDLVGYEKQASQIIAHLLRDPKAPSALSGAMPFDLVAGFDSLLSAAPEGHVLHDVLDEAVWEAHRTLLAASPDPAYTDPPSAERPAEE